MLIMKAVLLLYVAPMLFLIAVFNVVNRDSIDCLRDVLRGDGDRDSEVPALIYIPLLNLLSAAAYIPLALIWAVAELLDTKPGRIAREAVGKVLDRTFESRTRKCRGTEGCSSGSRTDECGREGEGGPKKHDIS